MSLFTGHMYKHLSLKFVIKNIILKGYRTFTQINYLYTYNLFLHFLDQPISGLVLSSNQLS